jgi:hypothetical protein
MEFRNDLNGEVLRKMYVGGDDLTQPRMVDFNFVFQERVQALAFAGLINDRDKDVCIAYDEEKDMWEVIVKHHMVPDHGGITALEEALAIKAKSVGGKADGWGCFRIPRKQN